MLTPKNITELPEWRELVSKYSHDWALAAEELMGVKLTHQQKLIVEAIQQKGSAVSVTTPEGIGQKTVIAIISILYTILMPESKTVIVSPKFYNCRRQVIQYISTYWDRVSNRIPLLGEYFKVDGNGINHRYREYWGCEIKPYHRNYEEGFGGYYAEHLLIIVTEAALAGDRLFSMLRASLVSDDSRILLMSAPSEEEHGHFYDSHHGRAKSEENPCGIYTAIKLNAEDTPIISQGYLDTIAEIYGGKNSDYYRRMILGEFPGIREAVLESDMPKTMRFSMPDGSEWIMPLRVIARHHAQHHAKKHGVTTLEWLKSHTIPLFTADHNAIVEWAKTIPWENVAEYAHMLKPPKDRQEISWLTAEKIIE
ncbi:hypothetical protein RH380_003399 [Escherichia coli]|nr:hypothetical protein [Escherichia coli]